MKKFIFIVASFFILSCERNDKKAKPENTEQVQLIDHLSKQVKENPDSAGLRMKLVHSYDSLKMFKQAIAQTDSLIKRDSLNNGLWYTKAQLQEESGDTVAAIRSYEKALKIYPSVDAQLSLANLLAETKNERALLISRNVVTMGLGRETSAAANFIAGVYFARTGDVKRAIQLFDKAIIDNYTLMEAYMEKGFIYYDSKNYQQALQTFETALTVNKTYADAYYWKAKCNEALGNKSEALVNYKRSLGLDKQLKEAADAIKRLE
ncbi:MAG: tetratricopeptide repeat protein [Bacteroidota bacterium]|nr:tetratricopeptide repeat protein [Bacteroidota bacterium]